MDERPAENDKHDNNTLKYFLMYFFYKILNAILKRASNKFLFRSRKIRKKSFKVSNQATKARRVHRRTA